MTGRGLKKSSGDGHSGGGKFPHVYLGFLTSANRQQTLGNPTGTSANPMWTAIGLRQTTVASRHPQMMPAIGKPWHRGAAAEQRRDLVHVASGQRHWPSSSSTNEQRRISGGGTVASIGGVRFAGLINVTVVLAGPCRVCTGFTSKCFSTSAGNKSSLRSRIAFPHIDARERFNHFEICAADAIGQRPMSREISCAVQGIIGSLASSPSIRQKHRGAPTRYGALGLVRGGAI